MDHVQSGFDLASALVREHARTSSSAVTVVPVVVDDLSAALPILQTLAEVSGALFLDSADQVGPVPKSSNLLRNAAWKDGLDLSGPGRVRLLKLEDVGADQIDAVFDPPTGGVPSPGDTTILGLARAAAHGHLDDHEIAILVYRESALDLPARRAAWKASVEMLVNVPHPTLRTLIVAVEASVDIGLHCRTACGFRYAVESGRLIQRHGADDLRARAQSFAHHPAPMVLFLGAGFSATSRLPLGNQLRDNAIARILGIDDPDAFSSLELAERFFGWVKDHPAWMSATEQALSAEAYAEQLTLEQVVRAEVGMSGGVSQTLTEFREHHDRIVGSPGPAVRDLVDVLARQSNRIVLVGVNFDQLVETTATSPLKVFADDDEFLEASAYLDRYLAGDEDQVPYLKLHGTIERPATCVVSAEQTERGIGASKQAALRALIADPRRLWLYVGASMRDLDLLPVLGDESYANGLDEYWVAPFLVPSVETFAVRRLPFWNPGTRIADRMITETADAFFNALSSAWPDP